MNIVPHCKMHQITCDNAKYILCTTRLNSKVLKKAPTKPSTVFLGESLISGVRPRVIPNNGSEIARHVSMFAHTPYVCENIIANDKGGWYPEPNQALQSKNVNQHLSWKEMIHLQNIVHNEVTRADR